MTKNVAVRGVSAHHGSTPAIEQVDATFPHSSVTAITGGNGSGKSTLLAVVAGVHRPTRGEVERPRGGVAFVRQCWSTERPLPLTVRSAVCMGRWEIRGRWARLCAADHALVAEAMDRLGVADIAERQVDALSGGQQRRVLVAQALAQRAPVLLLDEPTAGVDAAARDWIEATMVDEAARGVVVVHATHDAASVCRADHRIHLSAGRVWTDLRGAP